MSQPKQANSAPSPVVKWAAWLPTLVLVPPAVLVSVAAVNMMGLISDARSWLSSHSSGAQPVAAHVAVAGERAGAKSLEEQPLPPPPVAAGTGDVEGPTAYDPSTTFPASPSSPSPTRAPVAVSETPGRGYPVVEPAPLPPPVATGTENVEGPTAYDPSVTFPSSPRAPRSPSSSRKSVPRGLGVRVPAGIED